MKIINLNVNLGASRMIPVLVGLFCSALFIASANLSAAEEKVSIDEVKQQLAERIPDIAITSLAESPVPGVYELVSDGQIFYISGDAKYVFNGDLIDMETRANLTESRKGGIHLAMIDEVEDKDMLIYEPTSESDRSITVFTDISCGYCRKLHAEMDQLLEGGVRVRYLMFPRAGLDTQAHRDLESVWCADNPQEAMTSAKAGGEIVEKSCENPIASHVALAEKVGLRGTPLIYLDNGQMVPGYRSAEQLVQMINDSDPQ